MALKFLNKKGWHTGSLRNIENVWKAEQKHEAEQKKLEELRKQIQEERERSEFRLLQEQAGLVPKQERLDFLYDSGLAVGKGNSESCKALESFPKADPGTASSSTKQQQSSVPGALFEDKPQSANDAWRKLHSDPLLLIKQREQEALARVKNNPIQMAIIRKSVEAKKHKVKTSDEEKLLDKRHHKKLKHQKHTTSRHHIDSENVATKVEEKRNAGYSKSTKYKERSYSEDESCDGDVGREKNFMKKSKQKELLPNALSDPMQKNVQTERGRNNDRYQCKKSRLADWMDSESAKKFREDGKRCPSSPPKFSDTASWHVSHKRQNNTIKLSEEERASRLQEMRMDAELHEEQRWKRLRKAEEDDAKEATHTSMSSSRRFLDADHKSVAAEKGGSSTIEESIRRRTHYSQHSSQVGERNAFRR